jgi:hypothetical protein
LPVLKLPSSLKDSQLHACSVHGSRKRFFVEL